MITGFRLAQGGAEEYFGVTPDLWCFGKVIGGGLPVGAFGGSRGTSSRHSRPQGPVYQAGTLSGNPLATAAGLAVLEHVTRDDYAILAERVANFARDLEDAMREAGLFALCADVGAADGPLPVDRGVRRAPTNFAEAKVALRERPLPRRSSTRCSSAASRSPRAPTRSSSCRSPTRRADLERTVEVAAEAAKEVTA